MDVNAELAARQRLIREEGMCGELSPDGSRICVLQSGHSRPHPWEANSPLAPLFAQAREAVLTALPDHGGRCGGNDDQPAERDQSDRFANPCIRCRVLLAHDAALSSIEQWTEDAVRHTQDMEKALAHSNRPGAYCDGGSMICQHCVGSCGVEEHDKLVEATLAALPAAGVEFRITPGQAKTLDKAGMPGLPAAREKEEE